MNEQRRVAIALSSPDGGSLSPQSSAAQEAGSGPVTRIVVGTLEEEETVAVTDARMEEIQRHASTLTHLHLWGISNLGELPELPAGLRCLDLRRCTALAGLRALPEGLDTLDLGGCAALASLPLEAPASLERLYVEDCPALPGRYLEFFLESLRDGALSELDVSRHPGLASLETVPVSVRRLVLAGCSALDDVSRIAHLEALEHLDLGGCDAVEELPDIPDGLRHLVLHGCDRLSRFRGQSIGAYDRGTQADANVAPLFQARRRFGDELAVSAYAKLLLLGDGRVGKSTLAKRLLWESLTPAEREDRDNAVLRPSPTEDPTHKMRFWHWRTPLVLPDDDRAAVEQRTREAGLELALDTEARLDGTARVWDFGGQEIYHNTHRLFAAEGAVFLIVWRQDTPDATELDASMPAGCTPDEWREWNRRRPLDYWLEYVYSMRPDARVALVCTHCPPGAPRPDWQPLAPRHAGPTQGRALECFYLDSLDDACAGTPDFQRLLEWLAQQLGEEAARIGLIQPAFFTRLAAHVDEMLDENHAARARKDRGPHLMLPWTDWRKRVQSLHARVAAGVALDGDDTLAITRYLHDAGHVFLVSHGGERAVLVDQEWATGLIYEMLRPGGPLHGKIASNGGWFVVGDLEKQAAEWRELSELERAQLLAFLEATNVVVPVTDRLHAGGELHETLVANEKWLLPDADDVAERLDRQMARVRETWEGVVQERFDFDSHRISEFEFRVLMAHLGRRLGRYATWFRTGLQAMPDEREPRWCLRLRWQPDGADGFIGALDAALIAREGELERLAEGIEDLLTEHGSPLARHARPARRRVDALESARDYFAGFLPRPKPRVGISSSGADADLARAILEALRQDGIEGVDWYRLPECRAGEAEKVRVFMEQTLRKAHCVILVLSDAYLRDDPEENWYCPWELADAILEWNAGERSIERTLVVYVPDQALTSGNVTEQVAVLFERLGDAFGRKYGDIPPAQRLNFGLYDDLTAHFHKAWQNGLAGRFFEERGTMGAYPVVRYREDGTADCREVVAKVRAALL